MRDLYNTTTTPTHNTIKIQYQYRSNTRSVRHVPHHYLAQLRKGAFSFSAQGLAGACKQNGLAATKLFMLSANSILGSTFGKIWPAFDACRPGSAKPGLVRPSLGGGQPKLAWFGPTLALGSTKSGIASTKGPKSPDVARACWVARATSQTTRGVAVYQTHHRTGATPSAIVKPALSQLAMGGGAGPPQRELSKPLEGGALV